MVGLTKQFNGVLKCLRKGEDYKSLPPRGPPEDLPSLSDEELEALDRTLEGRDSDFKNYAYDKINVGIEDGEPNPKDVRLPSEDELDKVNICSIDGSNQKLNYSSFYFIIARSALVIFRYSKEKNKPYHSTHLRDGSCLLLVDGNVFEEGIGLYTKQIPVVEEDEKKQYPILNLIEQNTKDPFQVTYDPSKSNKNPAAHALGWGVKLQQALELSSLNDVPEDGNFTVCIRDGPLFSTSVSKRDTVDGLRKTIPWSNKKKVLVSCSKRVSESTFLVQALLQNITLRNYWFPNQEVTDDTLKRVPTDKILLPRILKPGQRTPLMLGIPRARTEVVKEEEKLSPLICYYFSRNKPHTFIRMEIPKFMWDENKEDIEKAIKIVAWQHELGVKAPLVQLFADNQCQLQNEIKVIERQTNLALNERELDFPEDYEK
ncbi:MAG TPA: DNA double-strand break repair nuclease NurA [Candidatus Nanoarchaeia archaeon]|nr:DNA double-strand break repair nuclease NurA [Candidatus Nanoarchaeia archaeon]